eukprot:SAG11_NODE_8108_length_1059_cov_1.446875_1_plen_113_part_10
MPEVMPLVMPSAQAVRSSPLALRSRIPRWSQQSAAIALVAIATLRMPNRSYASPAGTKHGASTEFAVASSAPIAPTESPAHAAAAAAAAAAAHGRVTPVRPAQARSGRQRGRV